MKTALIVSTARPGPDASSLEWRTAFCEGLKRRGWQAEITTSAAPCDLLVVWGIRRRDIIAKQKAEGGEVCILERGYLGDRFAWTSVSFGGGLNGRGEFRGLSGDPERFQAHFDGMIKPWERIEGGYALIMGQVQGDQSIRDVNIAAWYQACARKLAAQGWPVRFRPHPKAGRSSGLPALPQMCGELKEALRGAGVVVTYNSNSAVEAALYGRPVIAADRGSMAWPVAGHDLTEVIMPGRERWAHDLAWCQWTFTEIQSGFCHEVIGL